MNRYEFEDGKYESVCYRIKMLKNNDVVAMSEPIEDYDDALELYKRFKSVKLNDGIVRLYRYEYSHSNLTGSFRTISLEEN